MNTENTTTKQTETIEYLPPLVIFGANAADYKRLYKQIKGVKLNLRLFYTDSDEDLPAVDEFKSVDITDVEVDPIGYLLKDGEKIYISETFKDEIRYTGENPIKLDDLRLNTSGLDGRSTMVLDLYRDINIAMLNEEFERFKVKSVLAESDIGTGV